MTKAGTLAILVGTGAALAGAPAAQAAYAPHDARYAGVTSTFEPIAAHLAKTGRQVDRASIYWRAKCDNGKTFFATTNVRRLPVRKSARAVRDLGYDSNSRTHIHFRLTLSFDRRQVTGRFRGKATLRRSGKDVTCRSPKIRFTANRKGVFAGFLATAPLGLGIDRKGSQVSLFTTAATARCGDGSVELDPAIASKIHVGRHGRFKGSSKLRGKTRRGNHFVARTSVAGRVRGSRASGTFRLRVRYTRPSGRKLTTCDSGRRHWSARHS
jgi:hypothetical protein